mmetsp:Transcript_27937/g.73724  ORF Transcript_27937/g.73724 Transcript_27937/m.73724 type:complete len:84 (+) Transcript_27937:409-660(+)
MKTEGKPSPFFDPPLVLRASVSRSPRRQAQVRQQELDISPRANSELEAKISHASLGQTEIVALRERLLRKRQSLHLDSSDLGI